MFKDVFIKSLPLRLSGLCLGFRKLESVDFVNLILDEKVYLHIAKQTRFNHVSAPLAKRTPGWDCTAAHIKV